MGEILVYILCALTSLICAILLFRSYRSVQTRMIFWTALCFFLIFVNNILMILDTVVFPGPAIDLSPYRLATSIVAGVSITYGLVWDSI